MNPIRVFGIEQNRLAHGHEGFGKIHLLLATLRNGHPTKNDVKTVQIQSRNDAGPQGVDKNGLDPQGFGHLYPDIDIKTHKFDLAALAAEPPVPDFLLPQTASFVDHLKRHISHFKTDVQFTTLHNTFQGRAF